MPKLTFRPQALEKLASPEQLDQLIRVTTLKNWLALLGTACLLVPLLAWSLWGSLETRTEAQGLLLPTGGLCGVSAPQIGQISTVHVRLGQEVQVGQGLVSMQPADPGSPPEELSSPCSGKVAGLSVRAGDWVERGLALVMIEPSGQPLEVVAYMGLEKARAILPDMPVLISPAGLQAEVNGYLMGTVALVGQYPIDPQVLARQVGSQSLAQTFLQSGTLVEIHINLTSAPGGYRWSLNRPPGQSLTSGTPCSVSILLERQAPVAVIFPGFK
jgi:multidrug efflux pump subunit AcrA (membrane-fusion protein)